MLRTIALGSYLFIQGTFVRALDNGRIIVRVGSRQFEGLPVGASPN